jgi:hypothetical protein
MKKNYKIKMSSTESFINKILFELKPLNPQYLVDFNDPHYTEHYITLNQNNYMVISQDFIDVFTEITIYKKDCIHYDIMAPQGLNDFFIEYLPNHYNTRDTIFNFKIEFENKKDDNIILLMTNVVKIIVPF